MMNLLMRDDKSLRITNIRPIYQYDSLMDALRVLVPKYYESQDLSEFRVLLTYYLPDDTTGSMDLTLDDEPYNEDYISYTKIPKNTISEMNNLVVDVNQIRGKLVSYDSKIARNGFFYQENLISEEQMPDSIFTDIPDGYTVFKLKVNNETTYFNSIFPDDEIDLYIHTDYSDGTGSENKVVYGRFIKQIQVLAVKDSEGKNVFADKDNPTESEGLLFAVPEDLYLLLSKATYLGFDIVPVPRNSSYSAAAAATEKTSEELEAMIISKTYILQNECKDLTVCG